MAVEEDENPETHIAPKSTASPKQHASQTSSSEKKHTLAPSPNQPQSPKDHIISVATNISSQPLQNYDSHVWGVLTAISTTARKRSQGLNMLLTAEWHCFGRLVKDERFRIESTAVSANHCRLYRRRVATGNKSVFLKDNSSNGTYLNWEKLKKNDPEAKIQHGDIISFPAPPQHERAFAFVYREVVGSTPSPKEGAVGKRKAEEFVLETKRVKGIGIGAPEGPISLDDFRTLQRSNMELRKQLERQVLNVNTLRSENCALVEQHLNEMKEMRDSVTKPYLDKLKEIDHQLDVKKEELLEVNKISAEQKHAIEDLNERLNASIQSYSESNEIVKSQKASIAELKSQLVEERDQRREEREKAVADIKAAVRRAQSEAREESKRLSDSASKRERELQEAINKLTEREREWCAQVDCLRPKLEFTRQKLVFSDNKVRQLEAQVAEEQQLYANAKKRVEELEHETKRLRKELESEKQAAQEEAWAKVSSLEFEMNAAIRDLDFERRRLKGARERIMLREAQLRAFYSTTEEISALFAKQQEQLKAMQRTLEDEENYENTSFDMEIATKENINGTLVREKEFNCNSTMRGGSSTSAQRYKKNLLVTSSGEASITEKHDCDIRSQEEAQNTQEAEFTSADHLVEGGFGSDVKGVTVSVEGDPIETERVLETESPGMDGARNLDLIKSGSVVGDTMQLDDEAHVHDSEERVQTTCPETSHRSQVHISESQKVVKDANMAVDLLLLAADVIGSRLYSTGSSAHGAKSKENVGDRNMGIHESIVQAAESQSTPSSEAATTKWNCERQALSEMIGIVAPDLKEEFVGVSNGDSDQERDNEGSSISDTEPCVAREYDNGVDAEGVSVSDTETEGGNPADEDGKNDAVDEDDEATQQDSVG
ncbi:FHA domain-containing protein [Cephalotus follicularis]|uniref:FHA domain-containing protein n=1 Tax=Cephalotus follicularis TaxID=3775 RepID=A0A1Q3C6G8_CEPFO|nr:FHA domain-containing protein [Cephalotus follicularis]